MISRQAPISHSLVKSNNLLSGRRCKSIQNRSLIVQNSSTEHGGTSDKDLDDFDYNFSKLDIESFDVTILSTNLRQALGFGGPR
jgi:hypothetical protein